MARLVLLMTLLLSLAPAWAAAQDPPAAPAVDDLLAHVPNTSDIVVVVPSLNGLKDGLAQIDRELELNLPMLQDIFTFMRATGAPFDGVDLDGPAVVYIDNIQSVMMMGEPAFVGLFKASDYSAFLGQFGATASDSVTSFTGPWTGAGYSRQLGDYVAVSMSESAIRDLSGRSAAPITGLLSELGLQLLHQDQASLILNVNEMRSLFDMWMSTMSLMMEEGMYGDPGMAGMAEFWRLYMGAIGAGVRDTQSLIISLGAHSDGVSYDGVVQFNPGSVLGSVFREDHSAETYLNMLPNRPAVMWWASNNAGIDMARVSDLLDQAAAGTTDSFGRMMISSFRTYTDVTGFGSYWELGATPEGQAFALNTIYEVTDGAAFLERMEQQFQALGSMELPTGPEAPVSYEVEYEANAVDVEGWRIDRYRMATVLPEELTADNPFASMANQQGYLAMSGSHVLQLIGADEARMRAALSEVGTASGLASDPRVVASRAHALAPNPSMEAHVDIQQFAAQMLAMFADSPIRAESPTPVGLAGYYMNIRNEGVGGRVFVPYDALRWLLSVVPSF